MRLGSLLSVLVLLMSAGLAVPVHAKALAEAGSLTSGADNPDAMSADATINLLKDKPDLLRAAKIRFGQQLGVDPGTITDDKVFEAIRTDDQLRARVTEELQRMGFDTSSAGAQTAQALLQMESMESLVLLPG